MTEQTGIRAHLRAALTAAFLLVVCQIVLETVVVAARVRHLILAPYEFFGTQMYDFCVKLFLLLPRADSWLGNGVLDRFLPQGFFSKLGLASGFVVPNLVVGAVLVVLVAAARHLAHRPARVRPALWTLVAIGLVGHALGWVLAVHVPQAWTVRVVLRNATRVAIWDGTYVSVLVLVFAAAAAAGIARFQPAVRWAVSLGIAATAGAALLLLPPAGTASSRPVATAAAPADTHGTVRVDNVILISIDSLRADRVGCYGNDKHDTSPTLDRLAREGVRFANAVAPTSWTLPSHVSMLTGRYLLSHGVITRNDRIPDAVPMIGERLQQTGIATGGVVSAPLLGSQYGFARGFDSYDESLVPTKAWDDALRAEPAAKATDLAIDWLHHRGSGRFFLFLHFWDVHYDYAPPPPYDTMFDPDYKGTISGDNFYHDKRIRKGMPARDLQHILALYDGEIRWVDDQIQRLVAVVDTLGLSKKTAIVVTADHGDEFFEHGHKGHTRTLYREVVHVPLIVRVPGVKGGQVVNSAVSLVDILPTVYEFLGVNPPPGVDGISLVAAMTGGQLPPRAGVYGWLCDQNQSANCQAMQDSPAGTLFEMFQPPRLEFYRPSDEFEHVNIARSRGWPKQQELAVLARQLNTDWSMFRRLGSRQGTVQIDDATLERLRALGYAD